MSKSSRVSLRRTCECARKLGSSPSGVYPAGINDGRRNAVSDAVADAVMDDDVAAGTELPLTTMDDDVGG